MIDFSKVFFSIFWILGKSQVTSLLVRVSYSLPYIRNFSFIFHHIPNCEHSSFFTTYPSSFAWLHSSFFTLHSSPHTQAHSLGYTFHSSFFTLHSSFFILHSLYHCSSSERGILRGGWRHSTEPVRASGASS